MRITLNLESSNSGNVDVDIIDRHGEHYRVAIKLEHQDDDSFDDDIGINVFKVVNGELREPNRKMSVEKPLYIEHPVWHEFHAVDDKPAIFSKEF